MNSWKTQSICVNIIAGSDMTSISVNSALCHSHNNQRGLKHLRYEVDLMAQQGQISKLQSGQDKKNAGDNNFQPLD